MSYSEGRWLDDHASVRVRSITITAGRQSLQLDVWRSQPIPGEASLETLAAAAVSPAFMSELSSSASQTLTVTTTDTDQEWTITVLVSPDLAARLRFVSACEKAGAKAASAPDEKKR